MSERSKTSILVALVSLFLTVPLQAQEHQAHESASHETVHESTGDHDAGEGHHFHRNIIAGFIGVTGEDRRERALTLGLEYNRYFTDSFSIGVGVEHAFGDLDFTVYALPIGYRFGSWKVFAGPGWEKADHHESSGHDGHEASGGTEFLVRAGVEYIFELNGYELAPVFMVDFIDGDVVLVGGVAVGFGF